MPPKKKGGKGKKSKSSGKTKGDRGNPLTVRESILGFQIEVKERDLVNLTDEFRILKQRNRKLRSRNEQLKKEQEEHIKTLLKQAKENEHEVEQITVIKEEEVERAVENKIGITKELIGEQNETKKQIQDLVNQINDLNKTIAIRKEYKNEGQQVHGRQINTLKKKLSDMESSFQEVSAHLDRSLKIAKVEIEQQAETSLTKQKSIASEEAANLIKKDDRQEIADHKWLKKEISIHSQAFKEMSLTVEALEQENLEIMQELLDCKVEDSNLARKFYLTCVNDISDEEEVLAEQGVIDKDKVALQDEKLLENYYNVDDENYLDSPRLGPMDLQLLTVVGSKMLVHKSASAGQLQLTSGSDLEKTNSEDAIWPVSERMLQSLAIK